MNPDYDLACKNAAANQGLDPVIEALSAAEIPHALEQTGGFVMVVTVQAPAGTFAITASETEAGQYVLGFYPDTTWTTGPHEDIDYADERLETVVARIKEALH